MYLSVISMIIILGVLIWQVFRLGQTFPKKCVWCDDTGWYKRGKFTTTCGCKVGQALAKEIFKDE